MIIGSLITIAITYVACKAVRALGAYIRSH